ncbi:ribosome biogenesis GTP-binding protein YihA/YsxC [Candidatus Similichlamydia laticola]|uniref:GTP-binding protein EngB n=1 Tax=Candidatus Similichlamydia laticola TaxID=2170265 RepID=A0A369KD89_9BACT|nr:ribosome biogenesis GTP-binding protein YihA/YsxC [Candidatus Similichlamydia laticola]RDB31868.1 GTP-binding protein EngB [Candidatus Similichlamydia laticola]
MYNLSSLFGEIRKVCDTLSPLEDERLTRHLKKPKIVLLGRSNVGKSTLLNRLCGQQLVRSSKTPGSSQAFSVFTLGHSTLLIDTPGYGFTKAPLKQKEKWTRAWNRYLDTDDPTRIFLLLIDSKVGPKEQDLASLHWLQAKQIPFLLALTKCDRSTQRERKQWDTIWLSLDIPKASILPCSIKDASSWKRLRQAIGQTLSEVLHATH